MISEEDIRRINELYHKSKGEGLTAEETIEQQELRGRQKKQESFHGYQSLEWMNSEGVMPNCCWKCLVKYDGEVYPTR